MIKANLANIKGCVFVIWFIVLTGCQHIQTARQPLPFRVYKAATTHKTFEEKTIPAQSDYHKKEKSTDNKTLIDEPFFILEDWF